MAMDVVAQLKESGKVSRGWLGVLIQPVDRELAQSFGLDKPAGALVSQVLPGSPAEQAGIQVGDVVVRFNGRDIGPSGQLPQVVGVLPPGTKADAVVMRDGKRRTLKLTVGELPEDLDGALRNAVAPKAEADMSLGLRVESLGAEELASLKIAQGVRIQEVIDGPAAQAGIRPGDVLVSLNGKPIDAPATLQSVVKSLPDNGVVPVLIQREGSPRFLALRLGGE